ncbi:hypothetical protein CEXT_558251 [Caerostris extrusa]|uniref:Uncharacterized protein n=1 Tax=Caerostris extrusa TaxID=172846 RepID=A0AAV4WC77_CAEEX|nr:hypothetical protein CEXT_558251 [Caerostris extrusa]
MPMKVISEPRYQSNIIRVLRVKLYQILAALAFRVSGFAENQPPRIAGASIYARAGASFEILLSPCNNGAPAFEKRPQLRNTKKAGAVRDPNTPAAIRAPPRGFMCSQSPFAGQGPLFADKFESQSDSRPGLYPDSVSTDVATGGGRFQWMTGISLAASRRRYISNRNTHKIGFILLNTYYWVIGYRKTACLLLLIRFHEKILSICVPHNWKTRKETDFFLFHLSLFGFSKTNDESSRQQTTFG